MSKTAKTKAPTNGKSTEDIPEPDIPAAALENVDLGLPKEFLVEIMASKVLGDISTYHQVTVDLKAARHRGDHKAAEEFARAQAHSRNAAALIQFEYPDCVPIYKDLAKTKAMAAKAGRKAVLEAENGSE